jgi:hypothetical protein
VEKKLKLNKSDFFYRINDVYCSEICFLIHFENFYKKVFTGYKNIEPEKFVFLNYFLIPNSLLSSLFLSFLSL